MSAGNPEYYMSLAIAAAKPYVGRTSPNPAVGCVIVRDGEVLATGAHIRAGEDHAEIAALSEIGLHAEGADAYVTLEPCVHDHRDPHCGQGLVSAGIRRVFVGSIDPDSRMKGAGVNWLRSKGVDVVPGICEDECDALIRSFRRAAETGLPSVTLKLATTLDGRLADDSGEPRWITGDEARGAVHHMRDGHDAVMVGVGTILADDARLTTRLPNEGGRQPLRVVVDSQLRTPTGAAALTGLASAPTVILTCVPEEDPRWIALKQLGVDLVTVSPDEQGRVALSDALKKLVERHCHTVLCEGGGVLAAALLRERLVQRLAWFVAPKLIGAPHPMALADPVGVAGLEAPIGLVDCSATVLGDDVLIEGCVRYPGEES